MIGHTVTVSIGIELDEVQPPERRRMLILFPDPLSTKLDLYPAAFGCEILPGMYSPRCPWSALQPYGKRAGRAKPGSP